MSRATHGKYVHVATGLDEKKLLAVEKARPVIPDADEPDDIMAFTGDFHIDEEDDWDPSLY